MVLLTKTLTDYIQGREDVHGAVKNALERFNNKDWGNISPEDKDANERDILSRTGSLLARYETPINDIYIIKDFGAIEADDVTTVMFCNEY